MRQVYVPDNDTYKMYKHYFNSQVGAGYNSQGYIYSNHQVGGGLGGFFRSALKFAMPIGKKLLYKGWEMAKPEVQKIAKSGVDAITRVAEDKIKTTSSKLQRKFNSTGKRPKRRKVDALGS